MSKQEYAIWKENLGDAFSYLKPLTNENKELSCNRNMNKKLIRLTEQDLHWIVVESVNKVLRRLA